MPESSVLLIEPFYTGSHKVLMDLIHQELSTLEGTGGVKVKVHLATLPGKKWHWRARTSALCLSQNLPKEESYSCIFTSSVLPLHELLGLRPDLHSARKIVYFHENQLVYPVRKSKERDFQYGYNQILTCLVADQIWFNSHYNRDSFLSNIKSFFKVQPDFRPKELETQIAPKCFVKYFPMDFKHIEDQLSEKGYNEKAKKNPEIATVSLVWPHRWEFDKNPDLLFRTLFQLTDEGVTNFKINILGEQFADNPPIFAQAEEKLQGFIGNFGFVANKEDYYKILSESDIVISTANHEFFGVSMMESVYLGCIPLAPNNLAYPEIYKDSKLLYNDEEDLLRKLRQLLMMTPSILDSLREKVKNLVNFVEYDWTHLKDSYISEITKL